jgi:hypothetical protein
LRAWRLWAVENVMGKARLRSLYRSVLWPVGAPLAARCHTRRFRLWRRTPHEAPDAKCTCGIYAVPAESVSRLSRDGALPPGRSLVVGAVSLWGDVVECERGWRAGFAYPARLFVPSVCPQAEETAAGLEDYGVPVELLDVRNMTAALQVVVELTVS